MDPVADLEARRLALEETREANAFALRQRALDLTARRRLQAGLAVALCLSTGAAGALALLLMRPVMHPPVIAPPPVPSEGAVIGAAFDAADPETRAKWRKLLARAGLHPAAARAQAAETPAPSLPRADQSAVPVWNGRPKPLDLSPRAPLVPLDRATGPLSRPE